jgi:hypothetical protein
VTIPEATRPHGSVLGTTIRILAILLMLAMLGGVVLVLFAVVSLVNAPTQVAGGLGQGVGGAVAQAGRAAGAVQTAVQNATDPNHPPAGLTYDTEFTSLQVWHIGASLPDANRHLTTLQSIERRPNAETPETALYAVVHTELRQNQTRVFGQVIHSDSEPHDYVVYQGETFRIASTLYRVNWISQGDGTLAVGTYRHPDAVTAPLKLDVD